MVVELLLPETMVLSVLGERTDQALTQKKRAPSYCSNPWFSVVLGIIALLEAAHALESGANAAGHTYSVGVKH